MTRWQLLKMLRKVPFKSTISINGNKNFSITFQQNEQGKWNINLEEIKELKCSSNTSER